MRIHPLSAISVLLLVFQIALPGSAFSQDGRKTIVLVFPIKVNDITFNDSQRLDLREYLGTRLTLEGVYSVMPESQIKASLGAAKVESYQDCYDETCRIDMTRTVYADKSLSVDIKSEGSSCRITAVLYDIAQEATESAADVECTCGFKEIKQAMVGVAAQLSGKASALVAAGAAVIGGGTVKQGVAMDRGEKIVNAMTDKTGLLFIETDPPKAALMINGKPYGNAPYQDELMIGRYIVTASQNSYYHDAAQEIQLTTDGATLKLVLPPAFGTLNVTSTPDGAEVLIDDKPVGKTPFIDKRMKSGQYQVEVRRDLYAPVRRQVTVGDGRLTAESFNLAEDFGSLEVTSNPAGATIIIDENQTGKVTPALFPQLATGLHIVTIDLDGYGRRVENAKIGAGASEKLAVTLEPKMGRLTVMTVDESGAPCVGKLSIDGAPVGQTPWKGDLIATQHKVEARCGDGLKIDTAIVEHNAQKSMKLQMESSTVIKWVRLPGGTFQMGSNDGAFNEEPVRSVTVSAFEIAATEVTVAQYRVCVKAGVCSPPSDGWYDRPCNWKYPDRGNHPVNCLNWHQAETYAKWVGGRLPTEAEWEYAARSGGLNRKYPWGDHKATCDYAIMDDGGNGCGREGTWPVCSKPAGNTEQGLCDMAGNVWEWVYDWYGLYDKATSASGPLTNPMGPPWGEDRGNRGGSWYNGAKRLRTTGRDRTPPNDRNYSVNLGVRPVRSVR